MPVKYTHIMYLEYRICFLVTNIIISTNTKLFEWFVLALVAM